MRQYFENKIDGIKVFYDLHSICESRTNLYKEKFQELDIENIFHAQ